MANLALIPVHSKISAPQPAAFHELAAARYIGTNRTHFRELVVRGDISFVVHRYGKTRLYLKSDLDGYLLSRPKHKMAAGRKPADAYEEKVHERQN